MAILSGYQKVKKYVKEAGGFKLLSNWTNASTVEFDDGTTLKDLSDNLGDASKKDVDTTIGAASTSVKLPTSQAVASFVEGKGYTSNAGTITGIKMNGASKGTSGEVDLGTVVTDVSGKMDASLKGANNGVAELDATGKVPSSQLPSYVDDVIEAASQSAFPTTGETGKIYVAIDTNKTYRWSGSAYVEISESIALGETSATAYRGDRGKTAYDHASETKLSTATASGLYKVAGTANGHIASLTAVTKSDITGLGISGSDTTYTLSQDSTDKHKLIFTPSTGTATTVTVPDSDTKNTAGSTDSSSKLFLIGATSQAANPQTYSQDTAYVGTDGYLYSNSKKVIGCTEASASLAANATSLIISNAAITTSSTVDVFTSVFGVNPTNMVIAEGKVTFTFDATHVASTIKIRIS